MHSTLNRAANSLFQHRLPQCTSRVPLQPITDRDNMFMHSYSPGGAHIVLRVDKALIKQPKYLNFNSSSEISTATSNTDWCIHT